MAYEKQTWNCGDVITAEKLNNIEGGVENAQNGYECSESYETLTEQSVTTVLDIEEAPFPLATISSSYAYALYQGDDVRVTLNGVVYHATVSSDGVIGATYDEDIDAMDWSEYPFMFDLDALGTESEGSYTFKIEKVSYTVATDECFNEAVREAIEDGLGIRPIKKIRITETAYLDTLSPATWTSRTVSFAQGRNLHDYDAPITEPNSFPLEDAITFFVGMQAYNSDAIFSVATSGDGSGGVSVGVHATTTGSSSVVYYYLYALVYSDHGHRTTA